VNPGEFSRAEPGTDKFAEGRARPHFPGPQLEEHAQLVVDLRQPKAEAICVLPREPVGKARGRQDLEIVEDDDGSGRCLVEREKESMLALGWIRRTIDEDQPGALETEEGFALRPDIEGLDGPEAIPASRQRDDIGKIGLTFGDRSFELFGPAQPIRGVFDAGRSCRSAAEGMGRAARSKLESGASGWKKSGYLLEEAAALGRKDPGWHLVGRRSGGVVSRDEAFQLSFEIGIGGSGVRFSDNLSELLSPFRFAFAVSARF
jgi:hypothetical protein